MHLEQMFCIIISMIIMHVDANSAFLSWSSVNALKHGFEIDYRTIPAVVGGDESLRHGIVLAKSVPAKKYGIVTGESLMEARRKCPNLTVIPAEYEIYGKYSNAMYDILSQYTPDIQRYSVDECFLDYTASEKMFGDPVKVAYEIKDRIKNELGFTVNVGVSVNRVLAKMGSELQKPDRVHTLWPDEIEEKLWPLPVGDLFMVGRKSAEKLRGIGIYTIGDLAHADPQLLKSIFKSHGDLMREYANGIDSEPVVSYDDYQQKGLCHSMTIDHDVSNADEAKKYLLIVCDEIARRLRGIGAKASRFSISIRTSDLVWYGHQVQTDVYTDITKEIYKQACELFDETWHGEKIRQLGVQTSDLLYENDDVQISMFDTKEREEDSKADSAIDAIRARFGRNAIKMGSSIENFRQKTAINKDNNKK